MKKFLIPLLFSSSFCFLLLAFWGDEYMLSKELFVGLSISSLFTVIILVAASYKRESFVNKYLMVASISVLILMLVVYVYFQEFAVTDIK